MKTSTALAALSLIGVAAAAPPAPVSSPERARQAQCVVVAEHDATVRLLATIPTSADDRDAGEALLHHARGCDRTLLREGNNGALLVEMRGLLAEQLLAAQPLPQALPGQGRRRFGGMTRDSIELAGANRATLVFQDIAACVIDRDWQGARALLAAEHGSAAEHDALAALGPQFAACLNGVRRMDIPPLFARAAIAEEVWHRINDAPVVAAR